jgi:hypothetical protein
MGREVLADGHRLTQVPALSIFSIRSMHARARRRRAFAFADLLRVERESHRLRVCARSNLRRQLIPQPLRALLEA